MMRLSQHSRKFSSGTGPRVPQPRTGVVQGTLGGSTVLT
jgi:hypothetical protein